MGAFDVSFPFEQGFGATATSARWRLLLGEAFHDGVVFGFLNSLAPTYNSTNQTITVATGAAILDGTWCEIDTAQQINAGASGSLVAGINFATRAASLYWKAGVTADPWQQDANAYEIPIMVVVGGTAFDYRQFVNNDAPLIFQNWWGGTLGLPASTNTYLQVMSFRLPRATDVLMWGSIRLGFTNAAQSQDLFVNMWIGPGNPPTVKNNTPEVMEAFWPAATGTAGPFNITVPHQFKFNNAPAGIYSCGFMIAAGTGASPCNAYTAALNVMPVAAGYGSL